MDSKIENKKESHIDHWMEIEFIGLDMFANTDKELNAI